MGKAPVKVFDHADHPVGIDHIRAVHDECVQGAGNGGQQEVLQHRLGDQIGKDFGYFLGKKFGVFDTAVEVVGNLAVAHRWARSSVAR
jgi:hypothetical protein